jgi:exopolysaccharide biosynthesis protein
VKENESVLDDIMNEFREGAPEVADTPRELPESLRQEVAKAAAKKSSGKKFLSVLGKIGLILLETVLLLVITVYGVMFVLAKGPSPTARDLFVRSVRETSAIGFLANIYFSDEEIAQIEAAEEIEEFAETDTSLITIVKPEENVGPVADEWGLIDEDGDGIILEKVTGEGFVGYMMVVLDPSRVILGSVPSLYQIRGFTVEEMVGQFDAVAGINAGGFEDPDGTGNGSIPDTLVVYEGKIYYENYGVGAGFVGIDDNHILHVGKLNKYEIMERNIQYGVCFGPVLISNGEVALAENNVGGLNPRTAIGQRSDGAILMLVVDGRQVMSIGATYRDLVDIFLDYGAVNACNLDGGSSSMMWYGDKYINNSASVIGIRPVPTAFVVLKEGVDDHA